MTLSIGDKLVKLDHNGEPIMDNREGYVEYEVVDQSVPLNDMCPATQVRDTGPSDGPYDFNANIVLFAKLRKVR